MKRATQANLKPGDVVYYTCQNILSKGKLYEKVVIPEDFIIAEDQYVKSPDFRHTIFTSKKAAIRGAIKHQYLNERLYPKAYAKYLQITAPDPFKEGK